MSGAALIKEGESSGLPANEIRKKYGDLYPLSVWQKSKQYPSYIPWAEEKYSIFENTLKKQSREDNFESRYYFLP
jgi:hypothetical protein